MHGKFEKYIDRHYDSWVDFADHVGYGKDLRLVLVYRVDLTSDFAMATYNYNDSSFGAGLNIAAPLLSSSTAIWCTWHTRRQHPPRTNHGPQDRIPPGRVMDTPSLQPTQERTYNECVFVRYYTGPRGILVKIRDLIGLRAILRKIRGHAGPHDLGPGENTEGAVPEPGAQPDTENTGGTLPESDAQFNTETTDDIGAEVGIVIRKKPGVWFPQHFIVFALNLPQGPGIRQLGCR